MIEAIPIKTPDQIRRMAALGLPDVTIASLIRRPLAEVREAIAGA